MHKTAVVAATKSPCGYEKRDAGGDEKLIINFMWPNYTVGCRIKLTFCDCNMLLSQS